jgi:hypothetical protein
MPIEFNVVVTAVTALKTTELVVCYRWLSSYQILKLLKIKYDFHNFNYISIGNMGRGLGSIDDINEGIKFNNSGIYRRKRKFSGGGEHIMFYYFQNLTPPTFPKGPTNWNIIKKDSEEFDVESAITSRFESRKEQEFDSIDRDLAARTRNNNKKFNHLPDPSKETPSTSYWESTEANALFQP